MSQNDWFSLKEPDLTDSPALLIYPARVQENIGEMIRVAGSAKRLVPHVKTNKMPEVVRMQMDAGIQRFKCATIAEAEMLADAGVQDILLAYQLNVSKAKRYLKLSRKFPQIHFASLVDNVDSAQLLNGLFEREGITANVYIDIDDGMHRTGFSAGGDIIDFYERLGLFSCIHCRGFHVYDGQFHDKKFQERKQLAEAAIRPVIFAADELKIAGKEIEIIAGGTPTFTVHALNERLLCSPGTCVFWDWGYSQKLDEQHFLHAAILLTRIISKPARGRITTDLGHKSVAAENPIERRIIFLNLKDYKVVSQSEEHLVAEVDNGVWENLKVGDVLYGVPYHICPTVALYDEVQVVENGAVTQQWQVVARKKKITI